MLGQQLSRREHQTKVDLPQHTRHETQDSHNTTSNRPRGPLTLYCCPTTSSNGTRQQICTQRSLCCLVDKGVRCSEIGPDEVETHPCTAVTHQHHELARFGVRGGGTVQILDLICRAAHEKKEKRKESRFRFLLFLFCLLCCFETTHQHIKASSRSHKEQSCCCTFVCRGGTAYILVVDTRTSTAAVNTLYALGWFGEGGAWVGSRGESGACVLGEGQEKVHWLEYSASSHDRGR